MVLGDAAGEAFGVPVYEHPGFLVELSNVFDEVGLDFEQGAAEQGIGDGLEHDGAGELFQGQADGAFLLGVLQGEGGDAVPSQVLVSVAVEVGGHVVHPVAREESLSVNILDPVDEGFLLGIHRVGLVVAVVARRWLVPC